MLDEQLPAFERRAAAPAGPYDLGCLYIGTNDVRGFDWDPFAYERGLREALGFLGARCERTLTATIPLDLGRPRAGAKVQDANAIIERCAREAGALVVDLGGFRGRRVLMADHVHPTAFGQIAIAERALDVLERDGLAARTRPAELILPAESTRWRRLRGDATYIYRHAKVSAEAAANLLRLRLAALPRPRSARTSAAAKLTPGPTRSRPPPVNPVKAASTLPAARSLKPPSMLFDLLDVGDRDAARLRRSERSVLAPGHLLGGDGRRCRNISP